MSLREYVRKRKFDQTPEPAPDSLEPRPSSGRFFIQRHDATRLHYDFRLEIAGALKSWAVLKGPSLVPLQKNLAMHVEDHPLDYGEFEGNIPKGNYGAGSVMLWDKGTFEQLGTGTGEEQIERGDLKFRLHGSKLKGEFALVRMKGRGKGNEWLLIKKRDEFADETWDVEALAFSIKTGRTQEEIAQDLPARKSEKPASKTKRKQAATKAPELPKGARKAATPEFVTPMTAQPANQPPAGQGWMYEIKWDGIRAICHVEDGGLRMYSRNGNSYDRQFPELAVLPHHVNATNAILDGEIVVVDESGRASFELIQPRIHQTDANSIAHLARRTPVRLFLFDLLYLDGYDLRGLALEERKKLLARTIIPDDRISISESFDVPGDQMLEAAARMK